MRLPYCLSTAAALALAAAALATPAFAQTQSVTYLSRTGSGNTCTAGAPCQSLTAAVGNTISGGTVLCIDPGEYGGATVTRSITIDCQGFSLSSGNGIIVNDVTTAAPGTITVVIRGLSIGGGGNGRNGVQFNSGLSLTLDNVVIRDFSGNPDQNGTNGVLFAPTRAARLHISNSTIVNNLAPATLSSGVYIKPTGAGYASAVLENVQLIGNFVGLRVDTASSTAASSTNVVMNRAVISGSAGNGVSVFVPAGAPGAGVTITNSTINGNNAAGIFASGALSSVRVENTTIAGNSNGVQLTGGAIVASYGNNSLIGNGVNGAFNGFPTED